MAGDGYYPEYYLRKRKRDRAYSIATQVIGALLVFGGLGVLVVFLLFQFIINPRRTQAGVTPEMAEARQELSTEAKLADAAQQHEPAPVPTDTKPVELSQLSYADSMPGTSVAIQGLPTADAASSAAVESDATDSGASLAESSASTPPPSSTPEENRSIADKTSNNSTDPRAKKPGSGTKDEKRPDKKPDTKREDKKVEEKAATEKKEPASAPARTEMTVYRIYGGSAHDKAGADELRARLSAAGYGGSVIKSGVDYLVLVDTVEEFDKASALSAELLRKGFGDAFATRGKAKR